MSQAAASLAYSRLPFIRKYFLARAGLRAEKWLALAGWFVDGEISTTRVTLLS